MNLLQYIKKQNEKTLDWIKADEGRFATTLTENLEHWAGYGVKTPLQLDWYLAACDRHECHRDAYGYKPSWPKMPETEAELKSDIEKFDREVKQACELLRQLFEDEREAERENERKRAELMKPTPPLTLADFMPLNWPAK